MSIHGLIDCFFFPVDNHQYAIQEVDATLVLDLTVNPRNGMSRPGYMKATAKPRTHSWKIEPSKKGLRVPSPTKEEMELGGFRGVSMRQGGVSDALHTSPSRTGKQAFFRKHSQRLSVTTFTVLRQLETAAGPEADTTPGPLEPAQCGVIEECRDCGFGSCPLINVVKQRKVHMFCFFF